jgi:hypothetical protein
MPLPDVVVPAEARSVVIDLTRGATDPDGDPLRVKSARIKGKQRHGTLERGGVPARAALARAPFGAPATTDRRRPRTVTYVPDPSWRGVETIAYVLTDGEDDVAGTVRVRTPNRRPVAHDDTRTIHVGSWRRPIDIAVLENDTDPNHDALVVASVGPVVGVAGGAAEPVNGGRAIRYRSGPPGLVRPTASFRYTVSDGHGGTSTATVTIRYGNTAPKALDDTAETSGTGDRSVPIDVLANDSDPDGDALTAAIATQPAHGRVTAQDGTLSYTPDDDFPVGADPATDSFTYTASDGHGGTSTATVTVRVKAPRSDLHLDNRHAPQVVPYLSTRFTVSGIPTARHATATITVDGLDRSRGLDGWAFNEEKREACGDWVASSGGSTVTLVCHLSAADNGWQLGHFDPYATSISVTVSPDDFDATDQTVTVTH